jgi:hypothetical protein
MKLSSALFSATGIYIGAICGFAHSPNAVAQSSSSVPTPLQLTSTELTANLSHYFDGNVDTYLTATSTSIASQFTSVLFSHPEATTAMQDGDEMLSSYLESNPTIRSSLLLGPDGQIKGAALLHTQCDVQSQTAPSTCADLQHPILTIFLTTYSPSDQIADKFVLDKFREWGKRGVRQQFSSPAPTAPDLHMIVAVRELGPASN